METIIGDCPLGAKCEEVKEQNGKQVLVRCPWFVKLKGKNPQDGSDIEEFNCAIAWLPILSVNAANETRKGAAEVNALTKTVSDNNPKAKLTSIPLRSHELQKELPSGE